MEKTTEHPTILDQKGQLSIPIISSSEKYKSLEQLYEKAMSELDAFFELNWTNDRPRLIVVRDRETIDQLKGYETKEWLRAWIDNGDVYILDKDRLAKERFHGYLDEKQLNDEYFKLIKHELAHLFSQRLAGSSNSEPHRDAGPLWLWEGISIYLAGQISDMKTNLSTFLEYYNKSGDSMYTEGGLAVKYLVENHGKDKLLELIRSMNTINSEDEFKKTFKQIYGFELDYSSFTNTDKTLTKKN